MVDMKRDEQLSLAYREPYFRFLKPWDCHAFAIITAWNPASVLLSDIDNYRRNKQLSDDLTSYDRAKVWVGNQDFSWKEESYAVALNLDVAIEIGKRYQQNAIYYVDKRNVEKKQLFLISCLDDATKILLGDWQHRCV